MLWSRGCASSRDKLDPLCLHYKSTYGSTYVSTASITWFCEFSWQIKYFISPLALNQWSPNMVTYREELPLINSNNPLNIWLRKVAWKIKNTSPLSQCLWSQNLSGWWDTAKSSHPYICMTPQWSGLAKLCYKLIIITRRPMDTKLGKVLTYRESLPPLKPHDSLITWLAWGLVTIWTFTSPLSQDLRLFWQGADLRKMVQHTNVYVVSNSCYD